MPPTQFRFVAHAVSPGGWHGSLSRRLEARGSGLSHSAKCILPPIFLLGLSRLLAGCGGVSVFETWFVTITDLLKPAEPPPP